MFKDEDLHAEVEEMFSELQQSRGDDVIRQLLEPWEALGERPATGFRVFNPNPPLSAEQKLRAKKFKYDSAMRQIEERLLAGERPKVTTKRPTRWIKAARRVGIDLNLPDPKRQRLGVKEMRQRLRSGERPAVYDARSRWLKVAEELGINLSVSPKPESKGRVTLEQIRARLVAGERPQLTRQKKSRWMWIKVAEELGIDLLNPARPEGCPASGAGN